LAAFFVLVCLAAPLCGLLQPACDWDMLIYIGIINFWHHPDIVHAHAVAYADTEKFCLAWNANKEVWALLVNRADPYRYGVLTDPKAFLAQFPLYQIRPVYLVLIDLVSRLMGSFALATLVISVAATACNNALFSLFAVRRAGPFHGATIAAVFCLCPAIFAIAGLSTPDALATLAVTAGLVAMCSRANIAGALILAAGAGVRSDAVVLNVMVAAALAYLFLRGRGRNDLIAAVILLVSVIATFWFAHAVGNYGYRVLYHFTFLEGQSLDPSVYAGAPVPPRAFAAAFVRGVAQGLKWGALSWAVFGMLACATLWHFGRIGRRELALFAALTAGLWGREILFPNPEPRFVAPIICGMFVVLAAALGKSLRPKGPAAETA